MGQLSLGCRSKPGTCSPGGSTGPHGALRPLARSARPVHPRLARGQPAGPPPGGSPGEVGRVQGRHWLPRPCRPCAAALAGSVPGRPRGSGPAWQRPRFSPVLPGPTRKAGWREPEGVCPAAHWPGRACAPRGPAGRLSLCGQSETCPGGFVRAGQSRGPGSDQPTSSARDLLPAPSSDAERGLRRSPPMRVRWYNRDCGVYPLGARAITRPRGQRAGCRAPWIHPSPTRPARGHPLGRRVCHPRASHAVLDSDQGL